MPDFKDVAKWFEEFEMRLIQSLKRNLGRHESEEKAQDMEWSMWQAEKLKGINKFRRECTAIMNDYKDVIDEGTQQLLKKEFEQSASTDQPQFFGVDRTKLNRLIDDTVNLEKHAETAALRTVDDVYRQTIVRAQLALSNGTVTINQAVDIAVKDFLDKGINCIVYRDGRRVNIADYARMALRSASTRASLQGKSERFKALGYDTIQVSKYSMCSDTCLPWQGRVYINDVYTMWDGEVRDHGGILWGKSNYCGKWFMLLSAAIEKGLFHPNCRHTILLWRDGDPLPESIDNEENERRYKLEQEQRRLENKVRKAKRKVEGLSDPDNIKKAKAELREAQKQLREFIDKVNADEGETILKREYGKEKTYSESKLARDERGYTDVVVPKPDNKSQNYRPVQLNTEDEVTTQRDYEVKAHKAETALNNVYISENVDIKPKKLHQIDRHISEALDKMGITDRGALPNILVVSREDMATTDVAVYRAIENQLLICEDMAVYKPQDMPEAMEQLACSENDLSSYIHELYHWIDAEEYRRKFIAVTVENYDDYVNFINNKAKNKLDKLADKRYNILVSEYAARRFYMRMYYETYTEYRVKQLLKEG